MPAPIGDVVSGDDALRSTVLGSPNRNPTTAPRAEAAAAIASPTASTRRNGDAGDPLAAAYSSTVSPASAGDHRSQPPSAGARPVPPAASELCPPCNAAPTRAIRPLSLM